LFSSPFEAKNTTPFAGKICLHTSWYTSLNAKVGPAAKAHGLTSNLVEQSQVHLLSCF